MNTQNIVGFNDEILDLKYAKPSKKHIVMASNSSVLKIYDI